MKLNFKKISAIGMSVVLAGMTLGIAAAANFPAPFVQNGVSNVAVVYGTGAGVSSLDKVSATNIEAALSKAMPPNGTTVNISGENVLLQMPSSYLHLGNGVSEVFGRSITKSDMPKLLADGTYRDSSNNDHDYTQKIDVANLTLNQFNLENFDRNVSTNTPAIGFNLSSGENVLNYTLTFQSPVNTSEMQYTTLDLMGSSYYVLKASTTSLTLLDSASSASLSDGESTTLTAGGKTYTVSATIYGSNKVTFKVNNATTDLLTQGETYRLNDGSYIGVKNVASPAVSGGSSIAQFSIGSGKLLLNSGSDVQVNSNSVSGVSSTIGTSSSSKISSITIQWDTGDTSAITKSAGLTMPAFDGVKLTFTGMTYPKTETTKVSNDGNTAVKVSTTLENGAISLDVLGLDKTSGNYTIIGKNSNSLLKTSPSTSLNNVARNDEFVVSGNSGKVAESHVYKVNSFSNTTSNGLQVVLAPQDGGNQITLTDGQGTSIGLQTGITLTPSINYTAKTVNFTASGSGATFGVLYTKDGLKMDLPWVNTTALDINASGNYYASANLAAASFSSFGTSSLGYAGSITYNTSNTTTTSGVASYYPKTSYAINFTEADKNGNIGSGNSFQIKVGRTGTSGSYQTSVTDITGAGSGIDVGDTNVYSYAVLSDLATAISYDQGPTQETATATYHGGESYGKLYLTSPSAVTTSNGNALGNVLVTDKEVSSVKDDNLIIVGGSCINSAAATALGVSPNTCGADFTAATGIGPGQFLIKGVQDKFSTGKLALVVAGYSAADTTNAATFLTKKVVDTSKAYKGTSATEATLLVA